MWITDVNIKYCDIKQKYDLFINGEFQGKHYTILSLMVSLLRTVVTATEGDKK